MAGLARGLLRAVTVAWGLKANILNYCEEPKEAIPLAKQSIRLSPVAQTFFPEVLATAYYLCGQFEDAMTAANEALAIAPDGIDSPFVLAASLVETRRLDAAREIRREIASLDPDFTLERFTASRPYRDPAPLTQLVEALRQAGVRSHGDARGANVVELSTHAAARRRVQPRPIR